MANYQRHAQHPQLQLQLQLSQLLLLLTHLNYIISVGRRLSLADHKIDKNLFACQSTDSQHVFMAFPFGSSKHMFSFSHATRPQEISRLGLRLRLRQGHELRTETGTVTVTVAVTGIGTGTGIAICSRQRVAYLLHHKKPKRKRNHRRLNPRYAGNRKCLGSL